MNLQTFLLISKDSQIRQLVQAAAPQTTIHSTDRVPEGLALWPEISPALVLGEGSPHTLAPLLEYAQAVVAGLRAVVSGHGKADA